MSRSDPLVVFSPSGRREQVPVGTTVLEVARRLGVDLDTVCGGRGLCGRCQVEIAVGEMAKHGFTSSHEAVSPPNAVERAYDERRGLRPGCRLGCQLEIRTSVAIDVPPESQLHQPLVRKELDARTVELDPVVRLHYLSGVLGADEGRDDTDVPDVATRRLKAADRGLAESWEIVDATWAPSASSALAALAPAPDGAADAGVTLAVRDGHEVVGVWPGLRQRAFGIAADIGSTTIAAYLCDLTSGEVLASSGCMNPQIRYGEDVMSRVSYVALNSEGAARLTLVVREALADLIDRLLAEAGVVREEALEAVLVGNPIMHHLLLGLDAVPLGTAPFTLATADPVTVSAADLGLPMPETARVWVPPCIAGHVGADTAAVLLAEAPWEREEITLIVDVGTNAELVLGNRERLLAASSPTGPAFEGAQVSSGQRATPGAIERVRIDRSSLQPRFRVIGCELWSDDPGFEEGVAATGVTGICGSGIIEALAEMFLAGVLRSDGTIDGAVADRSDRVVADGRTFAFVLHAGESPVRIEQNDVRAIQLAKGALYAGARLLMEKLGVERVDRIRLAGAFGSHIDVGHAMALGMIPDCDPTEATAAGNAAGSGARIALLSGAARREIEARVGAIEKIETAVEPRFQHHFVDAMAIPHARDGFPELARVFDLPAASAPQRTRARRGRRRR